MGQKVQKMGHPKRNKHKLFTILGQMGHLVNIKSTLSAREKGQNLVPSKVTFYI